MGLLVPLHYALLMKEVEWNNLKFLGSKTPPLLHNGLNTEVQTPVVQDYSYEGKCHLFKVSNVKIMDGLLDWDYKRHSILIVKELMALFG